MAYTTRKTVNTSVIHVVSEQTSQGGQEKHASKNPVGKAQDRKSGTGQAQLTSPARTSRLQ